MVEYLLYELSSKCTSEGVDYKEATCLASGWALGMVLLGSGGSRQSEGSLKDLRVDERLKLLIEGGRRANWTDSILFQVLDVEGISRPWPQ